MTRAKWIVLAFILVGALAYLAYNQKSRIMELARIESVDPNTGANIALSNRGNDDSQEQIPQQEKTARSIAKQQAVSQRTGQTAVNSAGEVQRTLKTIEDINRINRMNQKMQEQLNSGR